jgi:hypothetical protein
LNGNPGWLTVKGHVFSGTPVNNAHVIVKLFKWNPGISNWEQKATLEPSVSNSVYEINNWNGVGPGGWLAKVTFPTQGGFGESSSDEVQEGSFEVKDGYRIKNKATGKCLDVRNADKENGAAIQQWDCLSPQTYQNQVFTLRPLGNSVYELIARHSGRCIDVANASQSNGATLQQWTCNGSAQQKWQGVPAETVGGVEYSTLIAQHSLKCMDVPSASSENGKQIQQWGCSTAAQQRWTLQSVESAPIPTDTGINAPEGERLNGQPGYATVYGWVHTGGYGIGGNTVKVTYKKKNTSTGQFEYVKAQNPVLNSEGRYEVKYEGLAAGDWQMFTEFTGVGNLAPSTSQTIGIHIGTGYRFVFRHSSKCLSLSGNDPSNGTGIIQWACAGSASPGDGQVFTVVPYANGAYFQIRINSTTNAKGKPFCVDVAGASTSNGAWLQQYECLGESQANQLWALPGTEGEWHRAIAKHSGRCMDVTGGSTADNVRLQQWDCISPGLNQQWKFQGIG